MKNIKDDNIVTLITVTPGELSIAPLGLQYPVVFTKNGTEVKETLKFKDGKFSFNKAENKELYEAIQVKLNAQHSRDEHGALTLSENGLPVMKAGAMKLPFMLIEDFEETIAKTPQRIQLGNGEVVEATPAEIAKALELMKAKSDITDNKKKVKEDK